MADFKNTKIGIFVGMLIVFFSHHMHCMITVPTTFKPRKITSPEKVTARKKAFSAMRKGLIEEKVASGVATLEPDEYFVFEADTGKGIAVPEKVLLLSQVMKNMIHDVGQDMPRAIPIFYTIEDFKNVVSVLKPFAMPWLYLPKELVLHFLPIKIIKKLSFEQLINAINIVHELHFKVTDEGKSIVLLGENFLERIWDRVDGLLAIMDYAVCDIKKIKPILKNNIPCESKVDIEEYFNKFCNDNDYTALKNLNRDADDILLSHIKSTLQVTGTLPDIKGPFRDIKYMNAKLVMHFQSPAVEILFEYWNPLYKKLELVTSITEFLDDIKDAVLTEIKQRKYREQQSKLWPWQRDKWF